MEITLPEERSATYEVIGSGAEPLLTFVGGPGLSAKLMRADAELFAERFTCYLIDPHGSGGSTPPQDEPPTISWVTRASTKRCVSLWDSDRSVHMECRLAGRWRSLTLPYSRRSPPLRRR